MYELNLKNLLLIIRSKFWLFFVVLILSGFVSYLYEKNQEIKYFSVNQLYSNDFENRPVFDSLNARISRMNQFTDLMHSPYLSFESNYQPEIPGIEPLELENYATN